MATILVVTGRSRGIHYLFQNRSAVVGRNQECEIQVLDGLVSRRHAEVRFDDSRECYQVCDMRSANGVFVNGRRIESPALLQDGDVILIGDSKLLFTVQDICEGDDVEILFKLRGEQGRSTQLKRKSERHGPSVRQPLSSVA